MREGERLEQDRIEDAEDGSGGADAEGEREDGGDGEARAVAKLADRVADRLEHAHLFPPV